MQRVKIMSLWVRKKKPLSFHCGDSGFFFTLPSKFARPKTAAIHYSMTLIQPFGASRRPIWMPVRVSYSFFVTGPISVMPLGKQISLP